MQNFPFILEVPPPLYPALKMTAPVSTKKQRATLRTIGKNPWHPPPTNVWDYAPGYIKGFNEGATSMWAFQKDCDSLCRIIRL